MMLIISFIIVLLSLSVLAQEAKDAGEELPAGVKEDYQSAKFYRDNHPSTWTWSLVDFNNPGVYENVNFVESLELVPASRYSDVKWERLDFTKIEFKDITWSAQLPALFHQRLAGDSQALDNYCRQQSGTTCGLTVNSADVNNVIFTGRGLNVASYSVTLKNYPGGTLFEVKDKKIIIRVPENQLVEASHLGADIVRFETDKRAADAAEVKQSIKLMVMMLPDGSSITKSVQGTLEYNNGVWFVPAETTAIIDNVDVISAEETYLYGLGGKDDKIFHEKARFFNTKEMYNYMMAIGKPAVFFGIQKMYAVTAKCEECSFASEALILKFNPENPYYQGMTAGENYYQKFPDKLSIVPISGGGIVSGAKELSIVGKVKIENGAHTFRFDNGWFEIDTAKENDEGAAFDTVSMNIAVYDNNFENPFKERMEVYGNKALNIINVEENNLVKYGTSINPPQKIDARHIVSEPESGLEVLKTLNNNGKIVVVIQTPYDQTRPNEENYFGASGDLVEANMQGARIIRLKMENADDLSSPDQQTRLQTHKAFLELLNEKQRTQIKEKHPFEIYIVGHSQLNIGSEGYMQTTVGTGHVVGKTELISEYAKFDYPLDVVGSSLGQWKI